MPPARRPPLHLFAVAVAFLLPVVYSIPMAAGFWSPRAALLLLVIAVGLPRLAMLAAHGEQRAAARAASAFVGVAALSAVLAPNHTIALFGLYDWGTGFLFVVALASAWAVGASLDAPARRDVERALLAAVLVNAVVGLVETVADLDDFHLGKVFGRAMGLLGNPVHLGTVCAAGLALLAVRRFGRTSVWALAVVLLAGALQASGTRAALLVLPVVLALAAVRHGRRLGALFLIALVAGLVLGTAASRQSGGVDVTARVSDTTSGGGIGQRWATWKAGAHAVAHKPLLGAGPGRFGAATLPYRTLAAVRQGQADAYYVDAHNIVVEYGATTGLLGLAALLLWIALALRRATGPLLGFGAVLLVLHLTEPMSVGVTPLAFLALGAAGPMIAAPPWRVSLRAATAALVPLALVAGLVLLAGDYHLEQALLDFSLSHARTANRLLPRWPQPASRLALVYTFGARTERSASKAAAAVAWRREATRRDRTDSQLWSDLAGLEANLGRFGDATRDFEQALRCDPLSVRALDGLGEVAFATGDTRAMARWFRRSLAVDPNQPTVRRRLSRLGGG